MRKKITAAVLIAAMAMMMVGCGKDDKATTASTVEMVEKVENTQKATVAENTSGDVVSEVASEEVSEVTPDGGEQISGGWEKPVSPVITPEIKSLVEKASETLTGAIYEPVAVLGTQVVAGTNYCLLCKETAVVPDAKPVYSIVTLYADLQGNAEFTNFLSSTVQAPTEQLAGGITEAGPEMTAEATTAFNNATAELEGATYTPLALMGTQVVAGTNYIILAEETLSDQNATTCYAILTVYAGVDGTYSIVDVTDIK